MKNSTPFQNIGCNGSVLQTEPQTAFQSERGKGALPTSRTNTWCSPILPTHCCNFGTCVTLAEACWVAVNQWSSQVGTWSSWFDDHLWNKELSKCLDNGKKPEIDLQDSTRLYKDQVISRIEDMEGDIIELLVLVAFLFPVVINRVQHFVAATNAPLIYFPRATDMHLKK